MLVAAHFDLLFLSEQAVDYSVTKRIYLGKNKEIQSDACRHGEPQTHTELDRDGEGT